MVSDRAARGTEGLLDFVLGDLRSRYRSGLQTLDQPIAYCSAARKIDPVRSVSQDHVIACERAGYAAAAGSPRAAWTLFFKATQSPGCTREVDPFPRLCILRLDRDQVIHFGGNQAP